MLRCSLSPTDANANRRRSGIYDERAEENYKTPRTTLCFFFFLCKFDDVIKIVESERSFS